MRIEVRHIEDRPWWLGFVPWYEDALMCYRANHPARMTDGHASGEVHVREGPTSTARPLYEVLHANPDTLVLERLGNPTIVRFTNLQREPGLVPFLAGLRRAGVNVWLDLDDDWQARATPPCLSVQDPTSAMGRRRLEYLRTDAETNLAALAAVRGAVVSTPVLAEAVRPHTPRVVIGPNALARALLPAQPRPPGRLRIGTTVSHVHGLDLKLCWREVAAVARAHRAEVHLFGVGTPPGRQPAVHRHAQDGLVLVTYPHMPFRTYLKLLRMVDVAVIPLHDYPEHRARSACKWLEYSLHAVPGVYAALPTYAPITHGVTGLLARTAAQYAAGAHALLADADLRARMGAAAQAAAFYGHGTDALAPTWQAAIAAMKEAVS
jgi:hypothetical protein